MLPDWIAESPRVRPAARARKARFIARTLQESAGFVEQAVFAEQIARRPGLLQRLDARAKAISIIGLIVGAAFLHHVPSLLVIAAYAAVAAGISRVSPRELLNRVWLLAPGVFVIVALPAALNVVTPGSPVLILLRLDHQLRLGPIQLPPEISLTRQGIAAASLVVTRVVLGVLLAVLLALTTRWQDLLKAAYSTATAPFVLILTMMYRYLFVLLRVVEEMHLARKARTITAATLAADRRWIGGRIGVLFLRSRRLGEQVYQAMLARGYTGSPRALTQFRFGAAEGGWLACCALVIALSLLADRVLLANLRW